MSDLLHNHITHYEQIGGRARIVVTDTVTNKIVFRSKDYPNIEEAIRARKSFGLDKMFNFGKTKKPDMPAEPNKPWRYYIHYNHITKLYSVLWFTVNQTLDCCYHGFKTGAHARHDAQDLLQRRTPYALEQSPKYKNYSI